MRKKLLVFAKYYIPVLIWMGVIFYFSSLPGLRYFPDTTKEVIFRKGAHFWEFAILSLLLWRVFYVGYRFKIKKAYIISLALSALSAAGDEFHQTFTLGRSGKIIDTVFDLISAILFLEIILVIVKRRIELKSILVIILSALALIGIEMDMVREGEKIMAYDPVHIEKSEERSAEYIEVNRPEDKNSSISQEIEAQKPEMGQASTDPDAQAIPKNIFIKVPFTTQAPLVNWDALHEEACEEASLIMIKYYLDKKPLSKNIAEKEIQALVAYENKNYGDFKDTTAIETMKLAEDYYEIENLKVIYDFKAEDIKRYLAEGRPIIVPVAGRDLGNPNFTPPGPLYHNLVLVGYDGDMIITNDPGTRKGEGYKYNVEVLYGAIHDFPGRPEDIRKGQKAMIVLE
jgi:VanZ family protein